VKLGQIIDLLLAAGYFRVRIKGLSSFDKVTLICLYVLALVCGTDPCWLLVDMDIIQHF